MSSENESSAAFQRLQSVPVYIQLPYILSTNRIFPDKYKESSVMIIALLTSLQSQQVTTDHRRSAVITSCSQAVTSRTRITASITASSVP
jgi:hypothetical protein